MKMHPSLMVTNDVNRNFSLQVHIREKREGLIVLKPIGSINTITSQSLQNLIERICAAKPNIIMFDLKQVDFINSKGLRVILKVYRMIKLHGGRVVLMNFQPHIKEVFKIINALPEQQIFANWREFDNYFEAVQNNCADRNYLKQSENDKCIICAEIKDCQRNARHGRMYFQ